MVFEDWINKVEAEENVTREQNLVYVVISCRMVQKFNNKVLINRVESEQVIARSLKRRGKNKSNMNHRSIASNTGRLRQFTCAGWRSSKIPP